jgi:hypothetical protein
MQHIINDLHILHTCSGTNTHTHTFGVLWNCRITLIFSGRNKFPENSQFLKRIMAQRDLPFPVLDHSFKPTVLNSKNLLA